MRKAIGAVAGLMAFALAGCGGGTTTTIVEKTVVKEQTPEKAPAQPEPKTSTAPSSLPADEVRFGTPSGNIECRLSSESATCEIFRKSFTPSVPKPTDCMLDYGHRLTVEDDGAASFVCYGDSMRGTAERTLPYGDFLERGPMTCKSEPSGLTCGTNGGAFFLSVRRVALS